MLVGVAPAFAQSAVTRIEQDNPAVIYSGNWYGNSGPSNSNGTAALTNTKGARATVTFNGTGITWIGVKDNWSGVANLYLDGGSLLRECHESDSHC